MSTGVARRKLDGTFLAGIDSTTLPKDYPDKILSVHLNKQPTAEVKDGHKVVRLHQDDESASGDVETESGTPTSRQISSLAVTGPTARFVDRCSGTRSSLARLGTSRLLLPKYVRREHKCSIFVML